MYVQAKQVVFPILVALLAFSSFAQSSLPSQPVEWVVPAGVLWEADSPMGDAGATTHRIALQDVPAPVWRQTKPGVYVASLRISSPEAAGLRLHVTDMSLPAEARLFLSGDDLGKPVDVNGPFTGHGPLATAEFWSGAIAGDTLLVEVQWTTATADDVPSAWPFRLEALTRLAIAPQDRTPTVQEDAASLPVRPSLWGNRVIHHEVRPDGTGVVESDILLPATSLRPATEDEVAHAGAASSAKQRASIGLSYTTMRWPGGIIPYVVDPAIISTSPTTPTLQRINQAINKWNTILAGTIQLIPRTAQHTNYVLFHKAASSGTCSSYIGMSGGEQPVEVGSSCSEGNIIHEIGHAVGLWHEQSREDRNTFIKVNFENVQSAALSNFFQNIYDGNDLGAYDYGSIMHYAASSFSSNGKPTIQTIPAGIPIGQRNALSAGDIAGVKLLYNAQGPTGPSVSITIDTLPRGQQVVVDGVTVVTPKAFSWRVGSQHTINVPDSGTTTPTRYAFASWSNGGARSQTLTVPSVGVTYTATLSVEHLVSAQAETPGTGTAQAGANTAPAYVKDRLGVRFIATPATGYCFAGWMGLPAFASDNTVVTITAPVTAIASFEPGSIDVSPTTVTVPKAGGSFTVSVAANSGCIWQVKGGVSWVSVTSALTGQGPGIVTYQIAPNTGTVARSTSVTVGGQSIRVTQSGE